VALTRVPARTQPRAVCILHSRIEAGLAGVILPEVAHPYCDGGWEETCRAWVIFQLFLSIQCTADRTALRGEWLRMSRLRPR
jgi:hypothetical protein